MTPALYAAVADSVTVFNRSPGVNPVFASRPVLLAIPGASAEVVDQYLAQRKEALAAGQPLPVFPVPGTAAASLNLWRIRAEVTMPDGASYIREAVIRSGGDLLHPVTILAWLEGDKRLFVEEPAR
jgi:hypothetical protein